MASSASFPYHNDVWTNFTTFYQLVAADAAVSLSSAIHHSRCYSQITKKPPIAVVANLLNNPLNPRFLQYGVTHHESLHQHQDPPPPPGGGVGNLW